MINEFISTNTIDTNCEKINTDTNTDTGTDNNFKDIINKFDTTIKRHINYNVSSAYNKVK